MPIGLATVCIVGAFLLAAGSDVATSRPAGESDLFSLQSLIALLTLTALEVVLGIDNIVFLAILVGKLPAAQQPRARTIGLALAMVMRILLLLAIGAIMKLTTDLFSVWGVGFSGKDLILLLGGLFLIGKATHEIHDKLEGSAEDDVVRKGAAAFGLVILQIVMIDLVFSLDSVITAVAMAEHIPIMIAAVVIAVLIMMLSAATISRFVEKHPTIKMLALSFLLLIGMLLVADGLGQHIDKRYVYFAMAFSLFVECLNIRMAKVQRAVKLNQPSMDDAGMRPES